MRGPERLAFALAVPLLATSPGAEPELDVERCYRGVIGERVVLAVRTSTCLRDPGEVWTETLELRSRAGGGTAERYELAVEDRSGNLLSLESRGEGYLARAWVTGDQKGIRYEILADGGNPRSGVLPLDAETSLPGPWGKEALLSRALALGEDAVTYSSLSFSSARLELVAWEARLVRADPGGCAEWIETSESTEAPIRSAYSKEGLLWATCDLAGGALRLERSQTLDLPRGAPPARVRIAARGRPPDPRTNVYRLPGALLPLLPETDPFQIRLGDRVLVRSESACTQISGRDRLLSLDGVDGHVLDAVRAWAARTASVAAEKGETLLAALRDRALELLDTAPRERSLGRALRWERGDCTGAAKLLCLALRALRVPARTDIGLMHSVRERRWELHAWVTAYDDARGSWVHLDPVWPNAPRSSYIRLSDSKEADVEKLRREVLGLVSAAGAAREIERVDERPAEK